MSRPRLHDDGYLAFLRQKPCCCGCGRAAPSEAAHIRIGFLAMGKKPDDRYAVPLNRWCHQWGPEHQHKNERRFWESRGLDPFAIAARLYQEFGGTGGKPRKKRQRSTARSKGPPMRTRTNPWPPKGTRKIPRRKFRPYSTSANSAD